MNGNPSASGSCQTLFIFIKRPLAFLMLVGWATWLHAASAHAEVPVPDVQASSSKSKSEKSDRTARYSIDYLTKLYQGRTYLSPLPRGVDTAPFKSAAREAALAYIAGVVDSGEGVHWCVNSSNTPPREIDQQLIDALLLNRQNQSSAAKALAESLTRKFACTRKTK